MRTNQLINESDFIISKGDFDSAIQKLNHALIIEPDNIDVKERLVEIYLEQDETESAIGLLNDLISKDNSNEE